MAKNLSKTASARTMLLVHDLNQPVVDRLMSQAAGKVESVATPGEVAARASVVVTMLPASPHVLEVYMGNGGLLEGVDGDSFVIDSSTIDAAVAKEVAGEVAKKGGRAIDAPVSG
ncbi:6-phosphogluconate dehydrogenase, partial [Jimgerdemannia flammicorona]